MGGPRVTGPWPDSTHEVADQMVVSVGPYIFHTSPRSTSSLASSRGRASPPHKILRRGGVVQPASRRSRQVAGGGFEDGDAGLLWGVFGEGAARGGFSTG